LSKDSLRLSIIEKKKLDNFILNKILVNFLCYLLRINICCSYCIRVKYTFWFLNLKPRDESRKEDRIIRDIVNLTDGLGDDLHVEQLRANSDRENNYWYIWGPVNHFDDAICGGNSGNKVARHDARVGLHLRQSRYSHRLHLWIHFQGKLVHELYLIDLVFLCCHDLLENNN